MGSWHTNVLQFDPGCYCQPPPRHVQAPPAAYGLYSHPTRDIVTSLCDVMSTFLKHPLSETLIKPKSQSFVDLIPKMIENEKLMEHLQVAFNAVRVAYEKSDASAVRPPEQNLSSTPISVDVRKFNLESYPQRLLLTFHCDWAADGVAVLHIDPVKPAILTIAISKPDRVIDIEKVICCDMDVYVSHRIVNQRCFVYLDQVNEADLVDHLEVHLTVLRNMSVTSYALMCKSST